MLSDNFSILPTQNNSVLFFLIDLSNYRTNFVEPFEVHLIPGFDMHITGDHYHHVEDLVAVTNNIQFSREEPLRYPKSIHDSANDVNGTTSEPKFDVFIGVSLRIVGEIFYEEAQEVHRHGGGEAKDYERARDNWTPFWDLKLGRHC